VQIPQRTLAAIGLTLVFAFAIVRTAGPAYLANGETPGMTKQRSNSGALAIAVVGILASVAGVTWLWRSRALPRTEPAASAPEAQPFRRPPDTPPPDPKAERERVVSAAIEHSAFLTRPGAEALVEDQERRGQVMGDLEEAGLLSALNGFSLLPPARAREVGDSFRQVYGAMSNDQRSRLESLLGQIRTGTSQPEHVAEAVTLLNAPRGYRPRCVRAFRRSSKPP
jgi:hypothetical protein